MVRFLVRRISLIALTLFVVSLAIFAITEILPGDVVTVILGRGATPENVENLRHAMGLDTSAYSRYFDWVVGVLQWDWGESLIQKRPIWDVILPRLSNSVVLAGFAFLIAVPTAIATGIWAGIKPGSWYDHAVSTTSLVAISLPEFVTGVLLIVIFSSTLHILPSSSILLPGESPLTKPTILILPTLTLTGVLFAYIMRMTRANVIEVMGTDYVRTAILKGLPMRKVIFRHVVPNAMLPTISVVAMNIGYMLGGLIIVDSVFAYPGLGRLLLTAITSRDIPLLQALSLLIAGAYAFSNLLADVAYAAFNPRVRVGS
ncbi:MAG: ABC transporter permease [Chloroflexi bacterium]|nr:ABC transporter permease [Chloroflexota bacterium]